MKKLCSFLLALAMVASLTACSFSEIGDTVGDWLENPCLHLEKETLKGIEATCESAGLTEGKKCLSCGVTFVEQELIPKKLHSYDGAEDKVCNRCGFINSDAPSFIVSETKAAAGSERVEVTVALKNNPGIASMVLRLTYDDTALQLTELVYNTEIGGQTVEPQKMQSPVTLYWIDGFANAEGDWVFATLYFDIAEDASGAYDICLSYEQGNVYDVNEVDLDFDVINGKVVIE